MHDSSKQNWNKTYKTRKMVAALDFAHRALSYLQSKPHCSILDIGCGDGRDSLMKMDTLSRAETSPPSPNV